jgi:hypothetical protein
MYRRLLSSEAAPQTCEWYPAVDTAGRGAAGLRKSGWSSGLLDLIAANIQVWSKLLPDLD